MAQGILGQIGITDEIVVGILCVILFLLPQTHNQLHGVEEIIVKNIGAAGGLPEQPGQLDGIAQRVDLIFPFPHPGSLTRFVRLPTLIIGLRVKGVGIGIDIDAEQLTANQASNQVCNILLTGSQRQIMTHLCSGIPQPHSGNITSQHKSGAILHLPNCGVHGIGIAVAEQLGQLGTVCQLFTNTVDFRFQVGQCHCKQLRSLYKL